MDTRIDLDEVREMRGDVIEETADSGDVLQKIHDAFPERKDSMTDQRSTVQLRRQKVHLTLMTQACIALTLE